MTKIAIVGCEASGKTTLIAALSEQYRAGNGPSQQILMVPADTVTRRAADGLHRTLRIDGKWPGATRGVGDLLTWTLLRDGRPFADVQLRDFGGEIFRRAFREESSGSDDEDVRALRAYVEGADCVVLAVPLDRLARGLDQTVYRTLPNADVEYDRDSEEQWVTANFLRQLGAKFDAAPTRVLVALAQADRYGDTLQRHGGAVAAFGKGWPLVAALRQSLEVIAVASVDGLTADGSPADGFRTEGARPLMATLLKSLNCDELAPARPVEPIASPAEPEKRSETPPERSVAKAAEPELQKADRLRLEAVRAARQREKMSEIAHWAALILVPIALVVVIALFTSDRRGPVRETELVRESEKDWTPAEPLEDDDTAVEAAAVAPSKTETVEKSAPKVVGMVAPESVGTAVAAQAASPSESAKVADGAVPDEPQKDDPVAVPDEPQKDESVAVPVGPSKVEVVTLPATTSKVEAIASTAAVTSAVQLTDVPAEPKVKVATEKPRYLPGTSQAEAAVAEAEAFQEEERETPSEVTARPSSSDDSAARREAAWRKFEEELAARRKANGMSEQKSPTESSRPVEVDRTVLAKQLARLREAANSADERAGRALLETLSGEVLPVSAQKLVSDARTFFEKLEAVAGGDVEAARWIAGRYEVFASDGLITPSPVEAFSWYCRAADAGDAEACLKVAMLLESGSGCTRNETLAGRYCLTAARKGHAEAAYRTGIAFLMGTHGFERSASTAWKYLSQAKAAGFCDGRLDAQLKAVEADKDGEPVDGRYPDDPKAPAKSGGVFGWL